MSDRGPINRQLFWLYEGFGTGPYIFRWVLLALDAAAITFFLWSATQERTSTFLIIDLVIAVFISADFLARLYIAKSRVRYLINPLNIADMIVIATLLAPLFVQNLAFLRILRAIRLMRAFTFLRHAKGISSFLNENSVVIDRVVNLVVFILIMTAIVYVSEVRSNETINSYLDALYFTVASLTTTGYGDIVVQGPFGKWIAIVIMVLGISLFLRLLKAIFQPQKVRQTCQDCGLSRHEPDAVHCKHCGTTIHIPKETSDFF